MTEFRYLIKNSFILYFPVHPWSSLPGKECYIDETQKRLHCFWGQVTTVNKAPETAYKMWLLRKFKHQQEKKITTDADGSRVTSKIISIIITGYWDQNVHLKELAQFNTLPLPTSLIKANHYPKRTEKQISLLLFCYFSA